MITSTTRKACAICRLPLEKPLLFFPQLPLTEMYMHTRPKKLTGYLDQELYICSRCGHGQLGRLVSPEILYSDSTYFLRTSTSKTAAKVNDDFVQFILSVTGRKKIQTLIDVGSSDLYLLRVMYDDAEKLIGIDPVLKGREKELSDEKITAIGDFFENLDLSKELHEKGTVVVSSHTLEHVEDPRAILESILSQSGEDTLHIHQFPGFDGLVADARYDQIFHQHMHYYSLRSFIYLLQEIGCELIDYGVNFRHWASLMVAFRKKKTKLYPDKYSKEITSERIQSDYKMFQDRMMLFSHHIESLRNEKIYGFGAALMLPILGYHLKNNFSSWEGILDDDTHKQGLYYINLPVPIRQPVTDEDFSDATFVVTALNTSRSVLPRILALKPKRILFPLDVV